MTPRYRETPWTLTAVKVPSGARVWYYYWYDGDKRLGPKTTGIGYKRDRDKAKSKKQAADYCAALFRSGRLGSQAEGVTLSQWVEKQRFFDWHRSKWVRGILARSEAERPGITEGYVNRGRVTFEKQIQPYHGGMAIDEITASDCEDLLFQWASSGRTHKTVNNWRSYYSTILAEAERLGVISVNPWSSVSQLRAASEKRGGLTLAEGAAVISPDGIDFDSERERMFYLATKTAMMTGLRLSEVAGLTAADLKSKTIQVNDTDVTMHYVDCEKQWSAELKHRVPVKDKDARAVPITPELWDELTATPIKQDAFVFSLRPDHSYPLPINRLEEWFNARVESLGIDRKARRVTFHSSRRFFNTLLRRRVSGDVLRKMTGHDGEEMTEHYTDYLPEDLAAITDAQQAITPRQPSETRAGDSTDSRQDFSQRR
jgi:integrase